MLRKVILIDDSEVVNDRNEVLLKSMDFAQNIEKYSNSLNALNAIKASYSQNNFDYPDLILLDLRMPEMDGFDFLNKYGEWEGEMKLERKPIIIILSDYLFDDRNIDKTNHYKAIGVVDHLKKPIDPEDLQMILEEHFEGFEDFGDRVVFGEIKLPLKPFKKLLPKFFAEVNEDFENLKTARQYNQLELVRQLSHKIKGVSASFYAVLQAEKASLIKNSLDKKETDKLEELIDELGEAIQTSSRYAKQFLDLN